MVDQTPRTIAVVGGGASGVLTAAHLLRVAAEPTTVILVERNARIGRGVAYGTDNPAHLLNVPAGKMSAWPDEPDDFLNWAERNHPSLLTGRAEPARAFLPRIIYGDYLDDLLKGAETRAAADVRLERVVGEAVSVRTTPGGYSIELANGETYWADSIVISTGWLPLRDPPVSDPAFYRGKRYVRDVWSPGELANRVGSDALLIVGTGLTMVDVAVTLSGRGHTGRVYTISRRGLFPQPHGPSKVPAPFPPVGELPLTARALTGWLRAEVRAAAKDGCDWRGVVDALRPITTALWQRLPVSERRRFMRHPGPYWEVHRHRVPTEVAAVVDRMRASGQLVHLSGRILGYDEGRDSVRVTVQPRDQAERSIVEVAAVLNCTGASIDCRDARPPFLESLVTLGLIQPDPLGLGLTCDADGALLDPTGKRSPGLFTVGAYRKGNSWETTAVPDLRMQAAALAATLSKGRVVVQP